MNRTASFLIWLFLLSPVPVFAQDDLPILPHEVVNIYPHDRNAFTQGLVYQDGFLYEGTGQYGESSLRKVELETGTVLQQYHLPSRYFGEGITIFENRIIQLTWLSHLGFAYRLADFEPLDTFSYPTEGWGITHDGKRLIMSDGSDRLYFLDPETYARLGQLSVRAGSTPVTRLNELEYLRGAVYANIWHSDRIARIDPETGKVTAWLDLSDLLLPEDRDPPVDVLNGIAYDPKRDRLFVTGKLWPKVFELSLPSRQEDSRIKQWDGVKPG